MLSDSKINDNYSLLKTEYTEVTEVIYEPVTLETVEAKENLTAADWGVINAVIYAGQDKDQIRQVYQYCQDQANLYDAYIARYLFNLGEMVFAKQKYAVAIRMYGAAIVIAPNFVYAYIRQAEVFDWREKHESAILTLKNALRIFPANIDILQYLVELLEFKNQYEDAVFYYQLLVEANPEDPKPFLHMLQLMVDHQMYGVLAEIADNHPLPPLNSRQIFRVLNLFVVAYEKTKQYEKVLSFANSALEFKPKRIALWEKKARVYMQLRNRAEALKCLNQIVRIKPQAKKYVEMRDNYAVKHNLC